MSFLIGGLKGGGSWGEGKLALLNSSRKDGWDESKSESRVFSHMADICLQYGINPNVVVLKWACRKLRPLTILGWFLRDSVDSGANWEVGEGDWLIASLMPTVLAVVYGNGFYLELHWAGSMFSHHSTESAFSKQGPKILLQGKWWNNCQCIHLSLSLSLTKTLAQSSSVTLAYGMQAGNTFPALSQTHFSLVICQGWE